MGMQVEIDDGLKQGEQVILNPPVNLSEGSKAQVRAEPSAAAR